MKELPCDFAQIVVADCPYNIGKNFDNESDKQVMEAYLKWCDEWIAECLRILKPNGTLYIYGFSEKLAYIRARLPGRVNVRWLIWHYTNKNSPSIRFWQRSHESILACWKSKCLPIFNTDEVREPYSEEFLKYAAGKKRSTNKGRYASKEGDTIFKAHDKGALPRDVIKIPALVGGFGKKERVNHPTQKPIELCKKLILASKQNEVDPIVIPFAGSGSECIAAKMLNIPFIGYEINPEYVALCEKRLAEMC